jgi:rhodanese-related sulfurtransferase
VPKQIVRAEVEALLAAGAQLVDVLPPAEFTEEHIAGAVNVPLRRLDRLAPEQLDRTRPVIVYCFDSG